MKKKFLFVLTAIAMLTCLFAISVSAEVTTYTDAPERVNIEISEDDVIVFDDGYTVPSAYVFKDVKRIEQNNDKLKRYLDFSYIEGKTGKTYTVDNIRELDFPQGITHVGIYTFADNNVIKRVTFPSSITSLDNAIFQNAKGLEECVLEFDESSSMTRFPSYMFYGCSNLKAFSMPDCFTEIYNVGTFTNCKALTAVYLSKNLTKWQSGGGGTGAATFDYCDKMYFVNEPFTYDAIPEKPDIYYFPANLQSNPEDKMDFSNSSVMRNVSAINQTLVFGTGVTSFNNSYFFQGVKLNVVFLGDMKLDFSKLSDKAGWLGKGGNWENATYYFANAADKSIADVVDGEHSTTKFVYCNAQDNSKHLTEKAGLSQEANCTENKMTFDQCFCGAKINRQEVEGTAYGHNLNCENGATIVSVTYATYDKAGIKVVNCATCHENCEVEAKAIFTVLGSSEKLFGDGAIAIGYEINKSAIADFEATGKTFKYGVYAVSKEKLGDNDIFGENGAFAGAMTKEITKYQNNAFELKLSGFTDAQKDKYFAMGAYVQIEAEGKSTYSYLQLGDVADGAKYSFVTYNGLTNE